MNSTPFLHALGKELNMDIGLSPSGAAAFMMDGHGLLLQWQEPSQSFMVYVEIGALAGWRDGEVCRALLSANFLLLATKGGAFSYDQGANKVGLNYSLPTYGMEPHNFLQQLNGIILLADECRAMLARVMAAQEQAVLRDQEQALSSIANTSASTFAKETLGTREYSAPNDLTEMSTFLRV